METRKISYDGKFELPLKAGNIIWRTDELAGGYMLYRMLKEKTEFADEVREALPKRINSVLCPVCREKKIAGRHVKVCKKAHKVKWFLRKFRR